MAGLGVLVLGGLVLCGWAFDVTALKGGLGGRAPMKPDTALAFVAAGFAVCRYRWWLSRGCALVVTLLGSASLVEHAAGLGFGIEHLVLSSGSARAGGSFPGRMAPATAFAFVTFGLALLADARRSATLSQWLALAGMGVAALALVGHLYGVSALYAVGMFNSVSLPAAVGLVILGVGVLALRPDGGLVSVVAAEGSAGVVARRLLPAAVVLPVAVGWVRLEGQRAGLYGTEFGLALFALSNTACFSALVLWAAASLNRKDGERDRVEGAYRASEARFHRTFDAMIEGCQIIGFDWRYLYVNDSVIIHARRSRDELIGRTMMEVYPGIDRTEVFGVLRRCMEDRTSHRIENRFAYPDGQEAWFDLSVQPSPEGIFVLSADITDRVRAAETVREQSVRLSAADRRLAELVTGMSEACFMLDADWRFTFVNNRVEPLLHYTPAALLGRTIWQVFGHVVGTPLEQHYRRAMADRVPVTFVTFSGVAGRWLDVRLFPTGDGLAAFLLDVHDRTLADERVRQLNNELEARVRERTAELEAANKELEAFSYSVSHDLRAPLRAIDGFARIVEEDFGPHLPEEARDYLRDVRGNAKQMGRLVDDLLAFSRLGRKPVARQAITTATLVAECLIELRPAVEGRPVDVRVGDLPDCQADPVLVKQVWLNLLSNALKYTGKRAVGVVEVGGTAGPGGPTYFVRDNGVGFDMRYAGKLFGVFQRLHRAEEYEGAGVGLAIVQRIVHRHGGRVWAESQPGYGATFSFTLPPAGSTVLTSPSLRPDPPSPGGDPPDG